MKRILLMTLLMSLTATLHAVILDDMIAKWQFDETTGTVAADSIAAFDCTITNGGWGAGKFDNASTSTKDFIGAIGQIPPLEGAQKFSFACWVNPNRANTDAWTGLFTQTTYTTSIPAFFAAIDTNESAPSGYLDLDFRICGRRVETSSGTNLQAKLVDNQWNLVVFTFDYTLGNVPEAFTVWVNGYKIQGADPANTDGLNGTYNLFGTPSANSYQLGQDRADTGRRFGGLLDETAIWTRVLSDNEITGLWANGQGRQLRNLGYALNPTPDGTALVNPADVPVTWEAPTNAHITSIDGYDVYFGTTEPNTVTDSPVLDYDYATDGLTYSPTNDLAHETTYYWRVNTHVTWDSNEFTGTADLFSVVEGLQWQFTTEPANLPPSVDAGKNLISSLDLGTPAGTVLLNTAIVSDDGGVENLEDPNWVITGYPGSIIIKDVAQMSDRGGNDSTHNPDLLRDWIGSDGRTYDNRQYSEPLVVMLSGVPTGTYTWTSYHHDPEDQSQLFTARIYDADGVEVIRDVDISNGGTSNMDDVTKVTATIVSNGPTDVIKVAFEETTYNFFVMNGFELVGTSGDPLKIDFGLSTTPVAAGYMAYTASHEVVESFTQQAFTALNSTITVDIEWGLFNADLMGNITITDTTTDKAAPTATFFTDYPGIYEITLTMTDTDLTTPKSGSDKLTVTVYEDKCVAGQNAPESAGLSYYDRDKDCDVDISDLEKFIEQWLDNQAFEEVYVIE